MNYIYLICPFSTLVICQLLKFLVEVVKYGKISINRLFNGNGGIPSSHTSFISSITMLIGFKIGFNTPIFALAFIMSCIISYDSIGVRLETERQAIAINKLGEIGNIKFNLKEELGHKLPEVIVGYIFGTAMAYLFSLI